MTHFLRACSLTSAVVCMSAVFCVSGTVYGQLGGGSMPIIDNTPLPVAAPQTAVAKRVTTALDENVDLGQFNTTIGQLAETLSQSTELPVFVDARSVQIAGLNSETVVQSTGGDWPLRSALRRLLQPHGLHVVVENEGLVVTADFTELTRRGIATDYWVSADPEGNEKISQALDKKLTVGFRELQLDAAIAELSEQTGLEMHIDRRALEEIGLTPDMPVTLRTKSVSLRSALRLMLRELDLTYHINNEVLEITTLEACENNLVSRVYFLESTGFAIGDFGSAIAIIETTIVPDTWESLGGPSTMAPLTQGQRSRPALLISTTSDVHDRIENLLGAMRKNHVGADPIAQPDSKAKAKTSAPKHPAGGGMF